VLKQVAEQHQDMSELVEKESVLVKDTYEFLLIQIANSVNLSKLKLINFVTALCLIELQQRQELFSRGNNNNGYHHQLG